MQGAERCPTVGVFDSGVGGLTVARVLLQRLPGIRLLYFADTAHVPYGPRPLEQIRHFALQIIAFLIEQGADAVVMGCNMSSASGARDEAAARFSQPIFEVIRPGSRAAVAASRSGKIGVIATQGTVQSRAYVRALQAAGTVDVRQQACPKFVPLVERGLDDGPEVDAAVAEYLRPLRDAGIDTLVFGCTHYPLLRAAVARYLGEAVTLIDPAEPVTDEVHASFGRLAACQADPHRHRFYCSGDPESLRREGERLLGFPLMHIEQVNVPTE
ncbi:MAG: glutamate racemase [Armatimonadota bacterium]